MLEHKTGNLLDEDVEALVNTVNCVGVMGRGIALQFKKAFPGNFKAYAAACGRGEVETGRMFVFEVGRLSNPKYIINFPTKKHWRNRSRMEYIESGLENLVEVIRERNIRSIAIPPLGSDLGGLDWEDVRPRIERALRDIDGLRAVIFEPWEKPNMGGAARGSEEPDMTPARAALAGLMHRYLGGLLDPFVTLLEAHKLMYFMQEAGEPLRLEYRKGRYGPYARNLGHVLNRIEGHFISGYADGGDAPDKQLELLPGAARKAEDFLKKHADTQGRFERVADLVDGFESSFGLELLSTVHWVMREESVESVEDVVRETYAWGGRKKQFSERQIGLAVRTLQQKGWADDFPLTE
ncbi:MAG: macro domain-containing protein [Alphaproteobacteria bacterium]|nr:macro domain-containing protein [Alphaproteobacteria bacterium]MDA8005909.1 macro domain-containing protein [Alphaproteobacteria bacterium]MDA8013284.1 macro domain-containing protein [Alphaproteobacteria bacterium]